MAIDSHAGASLYVPGTHKDLVDIAAGRKLGHVRNVIFCLEDAVAEHELLAANLNVADCLPVLAKARGQGRYIRPRNPDSLARVLDLNDVKRISGFVLPKFSLANLPAYELLLHGADFVVMPTLETAEVFDEGAMRELRQALTTSSLRERIIALRIGGNDLLALMGIRRPRGMTLYDTPMGGVISSLVRTFKPHGFQLTAPVFEYLDDEHTLAQELKRDLAHGLCGKTAIHPTQVDLVERFFRVSSEDMAAAMEVLRPNSGGVFKHAGAMCEPATHRTWAQEILRRGLSQGESAGEASGAA